MKLVKRLIPLGLLLSDQIEKTIAADEELSWSWNSKTNEGDSTVQEIQFKPNPDNIPTQVASLKWYTSMNEKGVPVANFNWQITDFVEPRINSLNPRMCFAIRQAGTTDKFDILYKSMLSWSEGLWSKKDGFTDDPMNFCRTAWDDVVSDTI